MKNTSFGWNLSRLLVLALLGGLAPGQTCFSKSPTKTEKTLKFPPMSRSLETLHPSILGVYREGANLYILPNTQKYFIKTPFKPGSTREKTFGSITDSKRIPIPRKSQMMGWRGVVANKKYLNFFDGKLLSVLEILKKNYRPVMKRSIAWDLLKPPADSRGEPPAHEVVETRTAFSKALRRSSEQPFVGWAEWKETNKHRSFFLSSRIKGFPLLLLQCDREEGSSCLLARNCWLPIPRSIQPSLDTQKIGGITYIKESKKLLLLDGENRRILVFKVNSCSRMTFVTSFFLPKKLKQATNLYVDLESNLWITTFRPDNYHNASLFYWKKSEWEL